MYRASVLEVYRAGLALTVVDNADMAVAPIVEQPVAGSDFALQVAVASVYVWQDIAAGIS